MADVELIGLDEDGEHVLLRSFDGTRFRLRIDEPLRAAVRRDRPQLEHLRASAHGTLPPREIQTRIRAGQTAQEVADSGESTLEQVRRYEGPVLAERAYIAGQAQRTRVGRDGDAPDLGDLVTDRLASRAVDTTELKWDSFREATGPWTVQVDYVVGEESKRATWSFDVQARTLVALDEESRWLSETAIYDEPVPRRHLTPVRSRVFDIEADPLEPNAPTPADSGDVAHRDRTAQILHDLDAKRGVRQEIDLDDALDAPDALDDDGFEGFGPQQTFGFDEVEAPGASTSQDQQATQAAPDPTGSGGGRLYSLAEGGRKRAQVATSATPDDGETSAGEAAAPGVSHGSPTPRPSSTAAEPVAARPSASAKSESASPSGDQGQDAPPPLERTKTNRKGRPKVPSWDEIVFGAKPE